MSEPGYIQPKSSSQLRCMTPEQFDAMQTVIDAAREYHRLCRMWDASIDARDAGTLDLLDGDIPAVRQRLWDALGALTTALMPLSVDSRHRHATKGARRVS